jgi:hypothetical protein
LADGAMPIDPTTAVPQIQQNISKEIRSNCNIEPLGMTDEMRGENINMILIRLEAWKLPANGCESLIPNGMVKILRLDFVAEVT